MRSASLLLLALLACAHAPSAPAARVETLRVAGATFELRYQAQDAPAARQVREALALAVPAAERWGGLSGPVLVTIHPTHDSLEAAAQHRDYSWLRAWTRYGSVDLQSPRTWSRGMATDEQMRELLAHEITHCVMYQAAATEATWRGVRIPLWFREGMATVTSGERSRAGPAEIRRFYRSAAAAAAGWDPLRAPEALYRSSSDVVYGAAEGAFRLLLDRYGEERVRRLLVYMGQGTDFGEAFRRAMGASVESFEGEYRAYVLGGDAPAGVVLAAAPAAPKR